MKEKKSMKEKSNFGRFFNCPFVAQ